LPNSAHYGAGLSKARAGNAAVCAYGDADSRGSLKACQRVNDIGRAKEPTRIGAVAVFMATAERRERERIEGILVAIAEHETSRLKVL
jgi:hypothetical protein